MIGVASLAGVLASMTLLGVLIWVVGVALLGYVTARREAIAIAVAQAIGLFVLASLVFIVAVVAIEFGVSGAWIGPGMAKVVGGSGTVLTQRAAAEIPDPVYAKADARFYLRVFVRLSNGLHVGAPVKQVKGGPQIEEVLFQPEAAADARTGPGVLRSAYAHDAVPAGTAGEAMR